jgi:hypothetical protein
MSQSVLLFKYTPQFTEGRSMRVRFNRTSGFDDFGGYGTSSQLKRFWEMARSFAAKLPAVRSDYQRKGTAPAPIVGSNGDIQLIMTSGSAKLRSNEHRRRFEIVDTGRPSTGILVRRLFNSAHRAEVGSGPIAKRSICIAPGTGGGGGD